MPEELPRPILGISVILGSPIIILIIMKMTDHFLLKTWPWRTMNYYADASLPYFVFLLKIAVLIALYLYGKHLIEERDKKLLVKIEEIIRENNYSIKQDFTYLIDRKFKEVDRELFQMEKQIKEAIKELRFLPSTESAIATEALIKHFV